MTAIRWLFGQFTMIHESNIVNQTKLQERLSKLGSEAILKCNAIVSEVGLDLEGGEMLTLNSGDCAHLQYSTAYVEGGPNEADLGPI